MDHRPDFPNATSSEQTPVVSIAALASSFCEVQMPMFKSAGSSVPLLHPYNGANLQPYSYSTSTPAVKDTSTKNEEDEEQGEEQGQGGDRMLEC